MSSAHTTANNHRIIDPYIPVTILSHKFSAFLDNGSTFSVLGQSLVSLVNKLGLKSQRLSTPLSFLVGQSESTQAIDLMVHYNGKQIMQKFIMLPESKKPVLLGRDFLSTSQISILTWENSWSDDPNFVTRHKFITPDHFHEELFQVQEEHSTLPSDEPPAYPLGKVEIIEVNNVNEVECSLPQYSSPSEILATWETNENTRPLALQEPTRESLKNQRENRTMWLMKFLFMHHLMRTLWTIKHL